MMENLYAERMADFDENYKRIKSQIAEAAERSGRSQEDIVLLAATKTVPLPVIDYAIRQGLDHIGENRVQELMDKFDGLDRERCSVEFIGRLQTNKVKYLVGRVSRIQSVDSVRLAQEISRQCVKTGNTMKVLVEVNIGREESKGGILPEALFEFIDEIREFPGITVNGLMAIPPAYLEKPGIIRLFEDMTKYYVDMGTKKLDNVSMECLSMGMSGDFQEAIQCGATMVRVGSSLFGKRK